MLKLYALRAFRVVLVLCMFAAVGIAGAIEHGAPLADMIPAAVVCVVVSLLALLASDLIGEEDGAKHGKN